MNRMLRHIEGGMGRMAFTPVVAGSMLFAAMLTCLLTACAATERSAAQSGRPIPRLEHTGARYDLMVDGRPFLILGGQAMNEGVVKPEDRARIFQALAGVHANTGIVPIHWGIIEPQPGTFDFTMVDDLINHARRSGVRLVLLWFGTWKNGEMAYTPQWLKDDRATYRRAIGFKGEELQTITPLSEAARKADIRAFSALMRHIREIDEAQRTVIMMQVENEPGLIGTDRDYSEASDRLFNAQVPTELMSYLHKHRSGLTLSLRAQLSRCGFRRSGTWSQVFGDFAPEAFSAWHIARYIDAVAVAGKEVYPLPMYVNAWLIEPHAERPGRYPSGGPTPHVLDIWKAAAPHVDLIAPDIYYPKFYDYALPYDRPDNPLFVPEVNFMPFFGAHAFMTFATFNGLAFAPYAIDEGVGSQGWSFRSAEFEDSYRVLTPLLAVIARYRNTGKMHAVIQGVSPGENYPALDIHLSGETVAAMVEFTVPLSLEKGRARGIIIELAPRDYIIAGAGFRVTFRELEGPLRDSQILSLEEGTFERGKWVPTKRLNGDELNVSLPPKAKIVRVRLEPR
jgi:hypothetical protein